jgi:hypothetical protein
MRYLIYLHNVLTKEVQYSSFAECIKTCRIITMEMTTYLNLINQIAQRIIPISDGCMIDRHGHRISDRLSTRNDYNIIQLYHRNPGLIET